MFPLCPGNLNFLKGVTNIGSVQYDFSSWTVWVQFTAQKGCVIMITEDGVSGFDWTIGSKFVKFAFDCLVSDRESLSIGYKRICEEILYKFLYCTYLSFRKMWTEKNLISIHESYSWFDIFLSVILLMSLQTLEWATLKNYV